MSDAHQPRSRSVASFLLTEREHEVFELAVQGLSARLIGERLFVSEATVRSHLASIYGKFGVSGRVELLATLRPTEPSFGARAPGSGTGLPGSNDDRPEPSLQQETPATPGPPSRPRPMSPSARHLRQAILAAAALAIVVAFLIGRPDLPPQTTTAAAQAEIIGGRVASIDIGDSSATLTLNDGSRQRIEGITSFRPGGQAGLSLAAIRAGVPLQASSGNGITMDELVNDILPPLAPPLALAAAAIWLFRRLRRPAARSVT